MKPLHLLLLALLCVTGHFSFGQENETRDLSAIDRIKILDQCTVHLTIGSPQSLRVEATTPLTRIRTVVEDGLLVVSGPPSVIYLTVPEIKSINISGIGKVDCDSLIRTNHLRVSISGNGKVRIPVDVSKLEINVSGLGKVELGGRADQVEIGISGSGKVQAAKLNTKAADVRISGVGKCYMDVTDALNLRISGSGSFYYKTKPTSLTTNISGIGKYGVFNDADPDDETSSTNRSGSSGEGGGVTVIGHDSDDDDDDSYSFHWDNDSIFRRPEKARSHWSGIDLGFNQLMVQNKFNTSIPDGYDYLELNSGKSINVNINLVYHDFPIYKRHVMFTTGLGLTLNNYRFNSDKTILTDTNRVVGGYNYDDDGNQIKFEKNKLAVNYVTVPLLLQFNSRETFKQSFHVGIGLLLSYKFNSHLKLVYESEQDGREKFKRHDEFNIRPFRYDATLRIGYEYYTFYASYSLSELFKENRGPSLHPFQAGIAFSGW